MMNQTDTVQRKKGRFNTMLNTTRIFNSNRPIQMRSQNRRQLQNLKRTPIQHRLNKYRNMGAVSENKVVIQENLQHLNQLAEKKRFAQAMYYGNSQGQSPLTKPQRNKFSPAVGGSKGSVHERLGVNAQLNPTGRRQSVRNIPINKNTNFIRTQTKQNKMNKIHQKNAIQARDATGKTVTLRPYVPPNNQRKGQKIQLRRNNNLMQHSNQMQRNNQMQRSNEMHMNNSQMQHAGPKDFTIQVTSNEPMKHHIASCLDPQLQAEIRLLQNQTVVHEIIPPVPIHIQGRGTTHTTLHQRFSQL